MRNGEPLGRFEISNTTRDRVVTVYNMRGGVNRFVHRPRSEGTMHRAEDVEAMTTDLVFSIRSALMAMPGRLAVDTAELETPAVSPLPCLLPGVTKRPEKIFSV